MNPSQDLVRIELDVLRIGDRALVHICDQDGILLVPRGEMITKDTFRDIQSTCPQGFYSTTDWPQRYTPRGAGSPDADDDPATEPPIEPDDAAFTGDHTVSVDSLRPGMRIAHPICDDRGVLLLAAHATITPRFLQLLRNRKLQRVTVRPRGTREPSQPRATPLTARLDALSSHLAERDATPTREQWSARRQVGDAELVERAHAQLPQYDRSVEILADGMAALRRGVPGMVEAANTILQEFIDSIALDLDIIPYLLALKDTPDEYLYHHCLNVSLLSMTIAAQMGFGRQQVHQLGLAGMLNDLGMMEVSEDIRLAPRPLTTDEIEQMQRHPVHTIHLLGRNRGIDPVVLFAVFQVHERCDGSGYPRRRHKAVIHPYARIIALADVYCAMTCPRPYRAPLAPYQTIEAILGQAKFGEFDSAALRGLLDCLSLYPIGSTVKLNTGERARVLRSSPGRYDRPVVVIQDALRRPAGSPIDLLDRSDLQVVRVLG